MHDTCSGQSDNSTYCESGTTVTFFTIRFLFQIMIYVLIKETSSKTSLTENLPKDADARREHLLDEGPRAVLCD